MNTYTRSQTSTYTQARVRYVMGKVKEDLYGLMNCSLLAMERVNSIYDSLVYLLDQKVLESFELQFKKGNGQALGGLRYELDGYGGIHSDEESGGIDYYALPKNLRVGLLVTLNKTAPNYKQVMEQLADWGWGTGSALTGEAKHLKNYSKDGYGLSQKIIGDWQ